MRGVWSFNGTAESGNSAFDRHERLCRLTVLLQLSSVHMAMEYVDISSNSMNVLSN